MNDYTPGTSSVRIAYTYIDDENEVIAKERAAAFDRWLAEVERAAEERGFDHCADFAARKGDASLYAANPYRKETR